MVTRDKVIPTSCNASQKVIPVVMRQGQIMQGMDAKSCCQGLLPGVVVFYFGCPVQFLLTPVLFRTEKALGDDSFHVPKNIACILMSVPVSRATRPLVDLGQSRWVIRCLCSLVGGLQGVDRTMASQR